MRSRRPHHKTRHGCTRCKERRIKCDESKPTCHNCQRYHTVCTYKAPTAAPGTRNTATTLSKLGTTDTALSNLIIQSGSTTPSPKATSLTPPSSGHPPCQGLATCHPPNVQDLQLLHHYTMVTCFTAADDPSLHPIFQDMVPQKAFSHPFLLHGVLAFSALHQAFLNPEDKTFHCLAFKHHRMSITAHRNALENLCKENWEVLFVSASLIVIFIAAKGRFPEYFLGVGTTESKTPLDHVVDFANFLQGILAVLMNSQQWVVGSDIGPLLHRHVMRRPLPENQVPLESLIQLQMRNESSGASEEAIKLYKSSIEKLQSAFYRVELADPDSAVVVLNWLVQSPDAYLEGVKSRTPIALAILAHHCVILQKMCHAWWSAGWGKQLLSCISDVLDEDWKESIKWPLEQLET